MISAKANQFGIDPAESQNIVHHTPAFAAAVDVIANENQGISRRIDRNFPVKTLKLIQAAMDVANGEYFHDPLPS